MADDGKVTESRPVEPVKIAVMAIGDASKMPSGTVARTEGMHVPDFVVQAINPITGLVVRFINVFFMTLSGTLSLKMTPPSGNAVVQAIQAADFHQVMAAGCSMAMIVATVGLVKDISTIFTGLAKKFPLLTGNV